MAIVKTKLFMNNALHNPIADQTPVRRCGRLRWLMAGSAVLLVPAILLWLVNLEIGIRALFPNFVMLQPFYPAFLYRAFGNFSADLSTVSTLVPVLLLWFPLVQSRRILYRKGNDAFTQNLEKRPYPLHFPFFLVMLGLAGTLYGLLLGLNTSGLHAMVEGAPSAEDLPAVLERLMDGTATALLSSLIGLTGAFLAARPLTFFFEWAAIAEPADHEHSLETTIEQLTTDLRTLGTAARDLSEQFGLAGMRAALNHLREIESSQADAAKTFHACVEKLDGIALAQQDMARFLHDEGAITRAVSEMSANTAKLVGLVENMQASQNHLLQETGKAAAEARSARETLESFTVRVGQHAERRERIALRDRTNLLRAMRIITQNGEIAAEIEQDDSGTKTG